MSNFTNQIQLLDLKSLTDGPSKLDKGGIKVSGIKKLLSRSQEQTII